MGQFIGVIVDYMLNILLGGYMIYGYYQKDTKLFIFYGKKWALYGGVFLILAKTFLLLNRFL